ncbi:hypothetical protein BGW36DRAFT_355826 [Talaromyces proteolyticus]|uniref:Cytochrome b561 domain-containing protein n=1 Tax=Talaromyces proteolyticus TaxID=1131652 RepID=A0AAD4KWL2_9EURO|nr:uncharacterized protein BGW36DRAFT_355826 [Talaromyces proteolyticus]KAH8701671.1 hypothetical protein BGW36DRAFT_355826 [Talaromyces proteolyticus]
MCKVLCQHTIFLFLSLSSFSLAQFQTFTPPGQSGITFTVNIPEGTATSRSGPIFIQLKSTTPLQWFAVGQGSHMLGANIFVAYGNGDNVTVSPRLGLNHIEPLYNSNANISLLGGSGISNSTITANVRCDSCIDWSDNGHEDLTSLSSPWIWAVKYGQLLDSSSVSADINMHDVSGLLSFNLQQATGGNSDNPFLNFSSQSTSGSAQALTDVSGQSIDRRRIAHATIMIIVMVVFFPMFALGLHIIPSSRTVVIHAWLQLGTLAFAIAGFGIGISIAVDLQLTGSYHPIIGIVVMSYLILFQPIMGFLQHRYFHKKGKKSIFAYLHRWLGRAIITLGIINAGLGFRITGISSFATPVGAVVAYGVVAGIIWVVYTLTVAFSPRKKPHGSSAAS